MSSSSSRPRTSRSQSRRHSPSPHMSPAPPDRRGLRGVAHGGCGRRVRDCPRQAFVCVVDGSSAVRSGVRCCAGTARSLPQLRAAWHLTVTIRVVDGEGVRSPAIHTARAALVRAGEERDAFERDLPVLLVPRPFIGHNGDLDFVGTRLWAGRERRRRRRRGVRGDDLQQVVVRIGLAGENPSQRCALNAFKHLRWCGKRVEL
mmetsp:Transcript_16238/g.42035  ORF Transcript_16238/g.42035 Transcript_16238/m.42035 type:complete len:203 (-) Transcript_16238:1053-1661(-)